MSYLLAILITLMLAYTTPSYEVAVERDVVYSTVPGYWASAPEEGRGNRSRLLFHRMVLKPLDLTMDIYTPEGDGTGERPLLLMMHGGSFLFGHKEEAGQAEWCRYFASLGYVAVSINYRLGFPPRKEELLLAEERAREDAEAALEYVLGQKRLRVNPDKVFLAGTSAGAITALSLAYQPGRKAYRVRAIANLWGAVRDLSILENARIPILSFQSVADPDVPYDEGYPMSETGFLSRVLSDKMYGTHAIHEKAVSLGIRAEHHPCPEPGHRLHLDKQRQFTSRFYEIRDAMAEFFAGEL
jgi:poly(3-hydroxybutyrate) depolymerase